MWASEYQGSEVRTWGHTYVYVMYIYTFMSYNIHMHTHTHTYIYIWIHLHTHTSIYTYIHKYIYTCIYIYICIHGFQFYLPTIPPTINEPEASCCSSKDHFKPQTSCRWPWSLPGRWPFSGNTSQAFQMKRWWTSWWIYIDILYIMI